MASVFATSQSRYWIASIRYWQPDHSRPRGGGWKQTTQSTKIPKEEPKEIAQAIADEYERTARKAQQAPDKKQFFENALARILELANVSPHKDETWSNWTDQWLAEQRGTASTVEKYRAGLSRLTEHLGERAKLSMRGLVHADLDGWYRAMVKDGLSVSTANQHFKTVRWCLERAKLHDLLDKNPAELVRMDESASHTKKPFSAAEVKKIFNHIAKHEHPEWRTACLFGLYYGLRIQDACGRAAEEISTAGRMQVITFVPMKKRRKGKPISLPLVGQLTGLRPGNGLITPYLAGMSNPSKVFSRILEDAGVQVSKSKGKGDGRDLADKTFHSWRHTTNTMLAAKGVDVRLRQLISDHESASMNARYTHPDLVAIQGALAPLAALVISDGAPARS